MRKITQLVSALALAAVLVLLGCGVEFDSESKVQSFRILGVRSSEPIPLAGSQVKLQALFHDGAGKGKREVNFAWLWGCFNPPGDIYLYCAPYFAQRASELSELGAGVGGVAAGGAAGSFAVAGQAGTSAGSPAGGQVSSSGGATGGSVPSLPPCDLVSPLALKEGVCQQRISAAAAPSSGVQFTLPAAEEKVFFGTNFVRKANDQSPDYGMSVVFFAACAGELGLDTNSGTFPPFTCKDPQTGAFLGPDDFVIGYLQIYSYAPGTATNKNPEIAGFTFAGAATTPDCIGESCFSTLSTPTVTSCDDGKVPCVAACADDGKATCPEIKFALNLDPAIGEADDLAVLRGRSDRKEVIWVRYFADRGKLEKDLRLVNDAVAPHWNPDVSAILRAPKDPGPMFVWAALYDNRGGVNFVRQTVIVR